MSGTPSSSSQSQQMPKVKTKFAGKKQEERKVVGVARGPAPSGNETPTATPTVDAGGSKETVVVLPSGGTVRLRPKNEGDGNAGGGSRIRPARGSEKREASEEPQTDYPQDEKFQKIDGVEEDRDVGLMEALEEAEEQTLHIHSSEYHLPLSPCEDQVDLSYLSSSYADDLSYAINSTNVGAVRQALGRRVDECMMAELCEDEDTELPDSVGASIFDHDSSMGLELDESIDHWARDNAAATWTRVIVVPRTTFFFPNEGEGGPDLATISGKRNDDLLAGQVASGQLERSGSRCLSS